MYPSIILCPVLDNPELSERALVSALSQQGLDQLIVLAIDQGSQAPTRALLDRLALAHTQLLVWHHAPPLPSLAATWNCGLSFAWGSGADDALVINNDVELPLTYYAQLRARMQVESLGFLSGVGVDPGQGLGGGDQGEIQLHPDFSAYVITREFHGAFPFDEACIPAYVEDVDAHRRALLADRGREIGKVNVPFLHYSSGTLKSVDPQRRAAIERQITEGSRAHYLRKWGGPVNEETFASPHAGTACTVPVRTGDLRQVAERGKSVRAYVFGARLEAAQDEGLRMALAQEAADGPF